MEPERIRHHGVLGISVRRKNRRACGIRGQPSDTLVHVESGNVWDDWKGECLPYEATSNLDAQDSMHEGDEYADWCVLPAVHWVNWGIYQPTRADIIDFSGANGHADTQTGRNIGADEIIYDGLEDGSPILSEHASSFLVEDLGMDKVPTDVGCNCGQQSGVLDAHAKPCTYRLCGRFGLEQRRGHVRLHDTIS